MGYLLPGVRVEQILQNPNANLVDVDLYPCVVGPVYRVIRRRVLSTQGPLPIYRYLGTWDATANSPNISAITNMRAGDYYEVGTSGTTVLGGIASWAVGNFAVYNGTSWIKQTSIGAVYTFGFPILDPGSVPDPSHVEVWLRDAWAEFFTSADGANVVMNGNAYISGFVAGQEFFTDPSVDFLQAGIQTGDRLWVDRTGAGSGYYVIDKVEQHTLWFRQYIYKTIKASDPTTGYVILRFFPEFQIDPLDYITYVTTKSVEVDLFAYVTYDTNGDPVSHPFISGQIETSYRALRADIVGLKRFATSVEVEALMENDVWNPTGFALCRGLFMANGNVRPAYAYLLGADNDSAYIDSLAELATYKMTYLLVPMTLSSQVANAFSAHVQAMSVQAISYFRITFVSRALVTQNTILPQTTSTTQANQA